MSELCRFRCLHRLQVEVLGIRPATAVKADATRVGDAVAVAVSSSSCFLGATRCLPDRDLLQRVEHTSVASALRCRHPSALRPVGKWPRVRNTPSAQDTRPTTPANTVFTRGIHGFISDRHGNGHLATRCVLQFSESMRGRR
jgi:hypothetical protein